MFLERLGNVYMETQAWKRSVYAGSYICLHVGLRTIVGSKSQGTVCAQLPIICSGSSLIDLANNWKHTSFMCKAQECDSDEGNTTVLQQSQYLSIELLSDSLLSAVNAAQTTAYLGGSMGQQFQLVQQCSEALTLRLRT